ncbi:SDR family oxidoreductase [Agriterribacter sp.]|uniref:SDR family NAD(P)-dependent oxidoreductase n=1 Tax=Agriterribacter sp. TaxID=2821509 RepID=UPI002C0E3141|nr:SDR family oxidoreductase [Agriterribacter sp.]HRP54805.1 SDR family oxidoreductase [Agriterribacter sp.]
MLNNKNIVIIGGTTGIGFSAAKAFIRHGAKVVAVGRHDGTGRQAQQAFGDSGLVFTGDAIQENTASDAIELCMKTWGSFDGLYHVAGGSGRKMGDGPLHELSLEGWNKTLELNLTSLMLSNRAAAQFFLKAKRGGSILNMGSVLGYSPAPEYFTTHAYAAAKAAVIGFSRSLAAYYAKDNIRVNVIAPGLVETPMAQRAAGDTEIMHYIKSKQPLDGGRIGRPGDLDEAACYFMSEGSRFTTAQVLAIDGGWSVSEGQISSKHKQ